MYNNEFDNSIVFVPVYREIGNLSEQIMVPANMTHLALTQYIVCGSDPRTRNMEKMYNAEKAKKEANLKAQLAKENAISM